MTRSIHRRISEVIKDVSKRFGGSPTPSMLETLERSLHPLLVYLIKATPTDITCSVKVSVPKDNPDKLDVYLSASSLTSFGEAVLERARKRFEAEGIYLEVRP